jgi:homoserine kinase
MNIETGRSVKVKSPSTVANLVCGFDVLGMCLHEPYDIMQVTMIDEPKVIIKTTNDYPLPKDPMLNTAGAPLVEMLQELDAGFGFEVIITKNIKPGSGLGSSAASAAGAVVAANYLLGDIFSKTDLVRFAMAGEKVASGVKHADNVAPCIFGGVTLIRGIFPPDIVTIPAPNLFVTVVHPQIEVRTADARQILKKEVLLKDAIKQWGNIAALVAGFMKNDIALIGRSLEDVIIEPVRSILIPAFDEIKTSCIDAGALGGGISGSGPSIFMLSENETIANETATVMKNIYNRIGLDHYTYVTTINNEGVTVIS